MKTLFFFIQPAQVDLSSKWRRLMLVCSNAIAHLHRIFEVMHDDDKATLLLHIGWLWTMRAYWTMDFEIMARVEIWSFVIPITVGSYDSTQFSLAWPE